MDLKLLNSVPQKPGVYLWKDKFDNIIYVGKANKLKNRMRQYFQGTFNSYKTGKMVKMIASFEYFITSSPKDALILERNLIEKHSPEYNIKLTDDKRYPYIKVKLTKRLEVSLVYRIKQDRDKAIFYGPFPTGYGAQKMVNLINRLTVYKNGLPYQNNHLSYWQKQYDLAKSLLSATSQSLISKLKKQMDEAASNMHYEIASDIKETLNAFNYFKDYQMTEMPTNKNIDVIVIVEQNDYLSIAMMFYRQGILLSKKERIIEIISSKRETIRQFVAQYYHFNIKPNYIISNWAIETDVAQVIVPKQGFKKRILKMALENAQDNIELKLSEFVHKEKLTLGSMRSLAKILGLESIYRILMIDNSNTNHDHPVSAIVSYQNGIKQKNEYRKYNLQVNKRQADVEYMKQGASRYFANKANKKPDLFIVDGGKAQIREVKKVIPKDINVIGLVKNDQHITDHLIDLDEKKVNIKDINLLNFLRGIQSEVDRFAKAHHIKRRKTTLEGLLLTIDGVGQVTEKKLLHYFKSYAAIYNATLEDLTKVVPHSIALKIKQKFKEN